MKKFISSLIIIFMLICCGTLIACDTRYGNLVMSSQFSYSESSAQDLGNGSYRVNTSSGTFDANADGSYTFYIENNARTTAYLDITFENVPGDFSFGAVFDVSNPIISINSEKEAIDNGVRVLVTATSPGQADIKITSLEGGKVSSVKVYVKQVAKSISFKNNNYAITNKINSIVDFSGQVSYLPETSTIDSDSITYEFGQMSGEDFVKYTNAELISHGFSFDSNNLKLTLIGQEGTDLSSLVARAIYLNPLGNDRTTTTTIQVISEVTNFELFAGTDASDAVPANSINLEEIQDFVVNINELNYVDIILKVKSNGEKVNLGYASDALSPFEITEQPTHTGNATEYLNEDCSYGYLNYEDATYTFTYLRINASKKITTSNVNYPNGTFTLLLTCEYSDYIVDGFPIKMEYVSKCYNLIKKFSINDTAMQSVSAGDELFSSNPSAYQGVCYAENLYLNTAESLYGTSFNISVADPVSILDSNSQFTLEFYNSSSVQLLVPSDVFSIVYTQGNTMKRLQTGEYTTTVFDNNTTIYIKLNSTGTFTVGNYYYVVLKAVKPSETEYLSSRAVATIKLTVTQGITSIDSFDYSIPYYEFNNETGEYVLNASNERNILTSEGNIAFTDYVSASDLNLDIEGGFSSTVTVNCSPLDANLDSLSFVSKNTKVVSVTKGSSNNIILIKPKSIGSTTIEITSSNLSVTYILNVNVYKPISDIYVLLQKTDAENGVGNYVADSDSNVTSVTIKAGYSVTFDLVTLPTTATQYTLVYNVKKIASDLTESDIGECSLNADGTTIEGDPIIEDVGNFKYNCKTNTMIFNVLHVIDYHYKVTITLQNINGVTIHKNITVNSYVPIDNMIINFPVEEVYNPNTIYYNDKITEIADLQIDTNHTPINDKSIFGVSINLSSKNGNVPSYTFDNYGKIKLYINNTVDSEYSCTSGVLTQTSSVANSIATLLTSHAQNGFYWFKLNDNYDFSSITKANMSIQVSELSYYVTRDRSFTVVDALGVSEIVLDIENKASNNYELYFEQGLGNTQDISLQILEESSYNQNLLLSAFNVETIAGVEYFILPESSDICNVTLDNESTSRYNLNLSIPQNAHGQLQIVIMPEDKLISSSQYSAWNSVSYLPVSVTMESFKTGYYFELEEGIYTLSTEYAEGIQYYVRYKNNVEEAIALWSKSVIIKVIIADGEDISYHISTLEELQNICATEEKSSKNYVLTRDIVCDSNSDWETIASNYYEADVNNLVEDTYYFIEGSEYVSIPLLNEGDVNPETTYYRKGFNGTLSGKYVVTDDRTGEILSDNTFGIKNISYSSIIDFNSFGLIDTLNRTGTVEDLIIEYSSFQPIFQDITSFEFGGAVAKNYGKVKNVNVSFESIYINSNIDIIFGGVVANNYGEVEQKEVLVRGTTGATTFIANDLESNIFIGGIIGNNEGYLTGSYDVIAHTSYLFNSVGYDTSLVITVERGTGLEGNFTNTNIGGAVGYNKGNIKNVSVEGKILSPYCDNVGGLVGYADFDENFNGTKEEEIGGVTVNVAYYSIQNSYSTAFIQGYDNVGGAIGLANGSSLSSDRVCFDNISAENYAVNNLARTFVFGNSYVGGLIGYAEGIDIKNSYSVSYFDCSSVSGDNKTDNSRYDVVGNNGVCGFIAYLERSVVDNCASYINVKAVTQSASIFLYRYADQVENDVYVTNVFARGSIYSPGTHYINLGYDAGGFAYGIAYDVSSEITEYSYAGTVRASNLSDIVTQYNEPGRGETWDIDSTGIINDGLPYLKMLVKRSDGTEYYEVLFASSSITIDVEIREIDGSSTFTNYIKNSEDSLVLFYNYDSYNRYSLSEIEALNQLDDITKLFNVNVTPSLSKTARLDVSSNNSRILYFDKNGVMHIVGTGTVTITFSSKLNSSYKKDIFVSVIYGLTDVSIYTNIGLTTSLNDYSLKLLKSRTQNLYTEVDYVQTASSGEELSLRSYDDIGYRFIVAEADLSATLDEEINGQSDKINNLFCLGNSIWLYNAEEAYYYVDVNTASNFTINPKDIIDNEDIPLVISYIPYIKTKINSSQVNILLTGSNYEGAFDLLIVKGATNIIIGNNTSAIEMNQLQTVVITVTVFTDYSSDEIIDNFDAICAEFSNIGVTKSAYTTHLDGVNVQSLTRTYTIWYQDKLNYIDGKIILDLNFVAGSNRSISRSVSLTIIGFDAVSGIDTVVFDDLDDFPHTPNANNVIYNGQTGLLSVEVYPYFAKYSNLRVYYRTTSGYSLTLTQISYDINRTSGSTWSVYENSGVKVEADGSLFIEKGSGQDTYLVNTSGIYSYSKSYFFSLLVSSSTPNQSYFTIYIEVINSAGRIIKTQQVSFSTLAQPMMTAGFAEEYQGSDNIYYLPYNTTNELFIETVNYAGDITWQVESLDYALTKNVINILTPFYDNGKYYVNTMKIENPGDGDTSIIGKKITITGIINDGQNTYNIPVNIIISLFTVTNISVRDIEDGYLTLPISTTTPLKNNISAVYDSNLNLTGENWYTRWYQLHSTDTEDSLYQNIVTSGYEVQESFSNYFVKLNDDISKLRYNSETETRSGVWSYIDSDSLSSKLVQGKTDYNSSAFGVERYNDYFAVYGNEVDKNSNMNFNVSISYKHVNTSNKNVDACGVPNVDNFNCDVTPDYQPAFSFNEDFILTFVFKTELKNYIPVSSADEFLQMEEGYDYRLVQNIQLSNYVPIEAKMLSFDGNNFKIIITSFGYSTEDTTCNLGLFSSIPSGTLIFNTTVCYANGVAESGGEILPIANSLMASFSQTQTIVFGGLACENNGTITNCKVTGGVNISLSVNTSANNPVNILSETNGGFVANNSSSGAITNSQVEDFVFSCYGSTGGFVHTNSGKIVACYFNESCISNLSNNNMGGFAYSNSGQIRECYSQGIRTTSDSDIRNTGDGLASYGGLIGGFTYTNSGTIDDCYSNIKISSSNYMAGFFYVDEGASVISRCYSISYKNPGDNSTTAFPFAGPVSSSFEPRIEINGELNNCFYLVGEGAWEEVDFYINGSSNVSETPDNKKAVGLTLDNFMTHTNFTNYDMSLVYLTGKYEDRTTYSYVDGYVWVIIEGKPVLVSTLVDTISMCEYKGKTKNYVSDSGYEYFTNSSSYESLSIPVTGSGRTKTSYYLRESGLTEFNQEDLIYSVIVDETKQTLTYEFEARNGHEKITIVYDTSSEEGNVLLSAECGDSVRQILDVATSETETYLDDNFRANDTILISYVDGEISSIVYKVLDYASYFYEENKANVSAKLGSRTNPYLISDYDSFCYYLQSDTAKKFYRIVNDIDLNYNFVTTARSCFQGVLQGNYMNIDNLSMSYLSATVSSTVDSNSFGLFASIRTVPNEMLDVVDGVVQNFDTVISNVTINVSQVLSNAHMFVGALAGEIGPGQTDGINSQNNQKIFLNNIQVESIGTNAYIYGKNAVGGLVGYASGNVIIKDITCDVSVNATYDIPSANTLTMLYTNRNSSSNISYAGGVIGIFDVSPVIDASTKKNYNASNVYVVGDNTYIGNIVGSAFGLIGVDTIINYVNVGVSYSQSAFIKAAAYGGGLVGENRGTVISSSIKYSNEEVGDVRVGYSNFAEYNFFFNSSSLSTVAIGGLVGLNNGGTISNSVSSINVRNKKAIIAGGAVGRMLEGKLENVITYGSVVSKSFMGGLIGSLNDVDFITSVGDDEKVYNPDAIIKVNFVDGGVEKKTYTEYVSDGFDNENEKVSVICSCVSGTNWLVSDYAYYRAVLSSTGYVGGFIGVVSLSGDSSNTRMNEIVDFEQESFYSNTLYDSSGTTIPASYLRPTHTSDLLDYRVDTSLGDPITLVSNIGDQCVYPYSTSEFYYNSTSTGISYNVRQDENVNAQESTANNVYASSIYTISTSEELSYLKNDSHFFQSITGSSWEDGNTHNYEWYFNHFGKIYYNDGSTYVLVTGQQHYEELYIANADEIFYYISSPTIEDFTFSKTILTSQNEVIFYGSENASSMIDGYSSQSLACLKTHTTLSLNGITIPLSAENLSYTLADEALTPFEVTYTYSNINLRLPDGGLITSLSFVIKTYDEDLSDPTNPFVYYVESITLNYSYTDVTNTPTNNFDEYVTLTHTTQNVNSVYTLNILTKKVIFKSFENGYWGFDSSFFANTYSIEGREPINLELADTYVWSGFRTELASGSYITEIRTAEDLAALAYSVNVDHLTYSGVTVALLNDIDLSGKYWVPIGTSDYPFMGTFKGQGESSIPVIKYVSVNEKSTYISNLEENTLPECAGLFGAIQGATIQDIVISGGEVYGKYAGGVSAISTNSSIINVKNSNNVIATLSSGGIVGEATSTNIINCINNGEVATDSGSLKVKIYMGGIVGRAIGCNLNTEPPIAETHYNNINYGKLNLTNKETNYSSGSPKLVEIYVGGVVGKSDSSRFNETNYNYGEIIINTNAHIAYAGGIVGKLTGYVDMETSIADEYDNLRNDSNITFSYENDCADNVSSPQCNIGGVCGDIDADINYASNLGAIDFITKSTTADVNIAGVAGNISSNVEETYNSGDISISSVDSITHIRVGGIVGSMYMDGNYSILNCYNSGDISGNNSATQYFGGILGSITSSGENSLVISNCMNIGYITIRSIASARNAIGSICGLIDNNVDMGSIDLENEEESVYHRNYYLRGSAYSGTKLYSGYGSYSIITAGYVAGEDVTTFCEVCISSTLKDTTYLGWDFVNTWSQSFGTWYPTLKNNQIQSYWLDEAEAFSGEQGVYYIENANELAYLSHQVNNGLLDTENIIFKLSNHIDLANYFWTPIGNASYPFFGTFDGNGYVIKNMTVYGTSSNSLYGGLFGYVKNATITNFGLESPIIQNVDYSGAIAYSAEESLITKVFTDIGESDCAIIYGNVGAGGLVYNLEDCAKADGNGLYYSYNNVCVSKDINEPTANQIGGIVGQMSNSYMSSCYNGENATITTNNIGSEQALNNKALVIGTIDDNCEIVNIFNLSPNFIAENTQSDACLPRLYRIVTDEVTTHKSVSVVEAEPTFANLTVVSGENLNEIWTKEYSLHSEDFINYPSLRGLGQNWKNTESDALKSYAVSTMNVNTTKNEIRAEVASTMTGTNATLLSFANENLETGIENIYLISSAEELSWVATNVNNGSLKTSKCEFILIADIDLSTKYWNPIGNASSSFQGIFNFNGHVISGLRIDGTDINYGGLFGYTSGAYIINGYIDKAFIKITSSNNSMELYAGGLVGFAENTTIKNISVSANIVVISTAGTFVGGIAGSITGSGSYKIENVHVVKTGLHVDLGEYKDEVVEFVDEGEETGTIRSDSIDIAGFCDGGVVYVGGIVGHISGYYVDNSTIKIVEYAENECNIAGVSVSSSKNVYAGGLIGFGYNMSIGASRNTGNVKTYSSKFDLLGGIIGYAYCCKISDCLFETGYVECRQANGRDSTNGNIWTYIGGIVGWMQGGVLSFCENNGLTCTNPQNSDVRVGAIIGNSKDRTLDSDDKCVYSNISNGFTNAIGQHDMIGGGAQAIEDVIGEVYIDDLLENDFETYWTDGTLNAKKIFVTGCGETSFKASSPIDKALVDNTNPGILLSSLSDENSFLYEGELNEDDKIGIAFVQKDASGNLVYSYQEFALTDNPFYLGTFIDDLIVDADVVTCFITFIRGE